tara:strand:- start:188 stop:1258 length:1071 start_codon:yes stop_codon:yes gene_type:complete
MRIALLQDHLRNGGTENQTLHIAEGLAQAGLETSVIVFREGGILDKQAAEGSFQVRYLTQGPLKTDWFAPGLKKLLLTEGFDVAIGMGRMANCQVGLLAQSNRELKLVSTFRTGKSIPYLQRRALKRSDRLVANSREALERLQITYGIDRGPDAQVIYNGCIRKFSTGGEEKADSGKRPIRLVCASMFRPEKKQKRLLQICSKLARNFDWKLTLAGDGPERNACIQLASRLGIDNRVEFPGLLEDPTNLYQKSDIAIHASAKESLPNALVEAQMSGLPVVAYDVGGVGETFDSNVSGMLIDHSNEDAFVDFLEKLIADSNLRQRMSAAAREYARKHFSPEAPIQAYIELLSRMIYA